MDLDCNCSRCPITEKLCRSPHGKGPKWCPTKTQKTVSASVMKEYKHRHVAEFARVASVQEGACYAYRDARPFVMTPTKTRMEELIEFCRRLKYKRLGLAFCAGLVYEASVLSNILEGHGFQVVGVSCKVGGIAKETIKIKDEEKVQIGQFESMCNPIMQAMLLNRAKTDFNIMLGLCIGHDSLFLRYIKKLTTVFAVKDRVTGHNPMATLYTANSYYQRLIRKKGDSA